MNKQTTKRPLSRRKLLDLLKSFGKLSTKGAMRYYCGKKLGHGANREVFELKQDPENWVVKIQYSEGFDNVKEWLTWYEIGPYEAMSKWFAECLTINAGGTVLIQKRVQFKDKMSEYPTHIPKFFTDLKIQNFGFIKDQLVCVDYGSSYYPSMALDIKSVKRAKWWTVINNRKPRRK